MREDLNVIGALKVPYQHRQTPSTMNSTTFDPWDDLDPLNLENEKHPSRTPAHQPSQAVHQDMPAVERRVAHENERAPTGPPWVSAPNLSPLERRIFDPQHLQPAHRPPPRAAAFEGPEYDSVRLPPIRQGPDNYADKRYVGSSSGYKPSQADAQRSPPTGVEGRGFVPFPPERFPARQPPYHPNQASVHHPPTSNPQRDGAEVDLPQLTLPSVKAMLRSLAPSRSIQPRARVEQQPSFPPVPPSPPQAETQDLTMMDPSVPGECRYEPDRRPGSLADQSSQALTQPPPQQQTRFQHVDQGPRFRHDVAFQRFVKAHGCGYEVMYTPKHESWCLFFAIQLVFARRFAGRHRVPHLAELLQIHHEVAGNDDRAGFDDDDQRGFRFEQGGAIVWELGRRLGMGTVELGVLWGDESKYYICGYPDSSETLVADETIWVLHTASMDGGSQFTAIAPRGCTGSTDLEILRTEQTAWFAVKVQAINWAAMAQGLSIADVKKDVIEALLRMKAGDAYTAIRRHGVLKVARE